MDALRRGAFFALAVVLGFLLLELPWNDGVFAIPQRYVIDNLLILGLGCAITFLAGQRTRASLAVFTGFCLLWGTANFFIITFKGQPIVPADLFALGTAASVAGGYSLFLTGRLVFCWALFAAYCIALAKLCPQRKRARWDVAANVLAAALLVCLGAMQYQAIDIKKDCEVTVDVWDVRGSYATQGTALCFLSRAQELTPKPPEGYSAEAVDAILAPFAEDPLTGTDGATAEPASPNATGDPGAAAPTTSDAAPEQSEALPYDGPNVIAIMNETFSDLSSYPGLEGTNAAPDVLPRGGRRLPGRRRRVRVGHGRGHLQQRVRVPHGRLHGQHGRRRVPLRALRFGRGGQPRLLLPRPGLRHPRDSPGRGGQLAARPHLRAARIRRLRRHHHHGGGRHVPRPCHGPRHLRARAGEDR